MKKFLAVLLAFMLLTVILCPAYVAETATEPPASTAPLIDLTQLILAVVVLIFNFLLAWLLKAVIPPLRKWLETHTSAEQQTLIWNVIMRLVEAAEQTITESGAGARKMAYVQAGLREHGFTVNPALIEAAVKEMNDKLLYAMTPPCLLPDLGEDDDPDDEDEEDIETE